MKILRRVPAPTTSTAAWTAKWRRRRLRQSRIAIAQARFDALTPHVPAAAPVRADPVPGDLVRFTGAFLRSTGQQWGDCGGPFLLADQDVRNVEHVGLPPRAGTWADDVGSVSLPMGHEDFDPKVAKRRNEITFSSAKSLRNRGRRVGP